MKACCSLAGFLGSRITGAIPSPRRGTGTVALQLWRWICLPPSTPLRFNPLFRQGAAVSLLRRRVTHTSSNGILTVQSIACAFRLRLRARLTPDRLALSGKPWPYGGRASHPPYRYLYLHLLFHALQRGSRPAFDAAWNAPLPILHVSHGFGSGFHTRLLSTPGSSTSELLRTL